MAGYKKESGKMFTRLMRKIAREGIFGFAGHCYGDPHTGHCY